MIKNIKTKLHSISLYPVILIFSKGLKGKKIDYTNFFESSKKEFEKENYLKVFSKEFKFFENIGKFFDKNSPIYDKCVVTFEIDLKDFPENKKSFSVNFIKLINIYHSLSMLSAKIPNENIYVKFKLLDSKVNSSNINIFLRYVLLVYSSKKVDKFYFDKTLIEDENSLKAYENLIKHLDNSNIQNSSSAKDLFVITAKKDKKIFDIVWSSNRELELTDFNKVYDFYANELKEDIKISQNPIYAYHK